MPNPSILNSIERKFILLVGDLVIIIASLNVFINNAIDIEFASFKLKVIITVFGVFSFLTLSYILDLYNLQKTLKRKYVVSQALYITALFVFTVFIFSVLFFDTSFWRIPLLVFLILTPIEVALWRLFFVNVFRVIPTTKNVLLIYDKETEKHFREVTSSIDGGDVETFYKVKLTYNLNQHNEIRNKFFVATEKVDSWIVNIKNYSDFPDDLEKLLLKSILKGKEVISYTSFYENTYEALPIQSHNDSFYEILQLRNRKLGIYIQYLVLL